MKSKPNSGFTAVELLVIVCVLLLLVTTLFPALARTQPQNRIAQCLNNHHQLVTAWRMYADDHNDRVIYNMGYTETQGEVTGKTYRNWANNLISWGADSSNTNRALLQNGLLAPYLGTNLSAYKCPSDTWLSPQQSALGWTARLRSISMNAFFGPFSPTDSLTLSGKNWALPNYRQWLKTAEVINSATTWVFIDEHPDSINDGYFLTSPNASAWQDIPASHHDGAVNLSFVDTHVESHKWLSKTSRFPVGFSYPTPPTFDADGQTDFTWLMRRTAVLY